MAKQPTPYHQSTQAPHSKAREQGSDTKVSQSSRLSLWLKSVVHLCKTDVGKSVLLHLGLVIGLVASVSFAKPAIEAVDLPSDAVIINAQFIDPAVTQARFDEEQQQRKAAQEARRKREQQQREQQRRREAEAERKRVEQQQAQAAIRKEEAKKQAQIKRQKELERQAQKALEAEKRREQAAQEQARLKEEALARQREADERLREALEAEQAAIAAQQRQRVLSEKARYAALIKATIQRNLITNDAFRGKTCRLNIRLGIGGFVLNVTQIQGDDALCRAAINAVYQPDSLPVSNDPAVFAELKDINLTVEQ